MIIFYSPLSEAHAGILLLTQPGNHAEDFHMGSKAVSEPPGVRNFYG
jgi:hypothetical protein